MALLALVVVVVGGIRIGTHKSSSSPSSSTIGNTLDQIPGATPSSGASQQPSAPAASPSPSASSTAKHHHKTKSTATASASASASKKAKSTASASASSHATHSATPTSTAAAIVTPTYGSYKYATSGNEKLAGQTRDFPSKSTIKLAKDGKCAKSTWQPTSSHGEVQVVCPVGTQAVDLQSETQSIGVAGFNVTQTLTCDSSAIVYSTGLKPGNSYSFTCSSSNTTAKQQASVIGFQNFTISGKKIKALHIHVATTISGADTGTATEDYWYAPTLGILVKQKMVTNAKQGGFTYQGHYALTLSSTKPS
jgi:hypothetical protein